jgi:hypothetical protein
VKRLMSVMAASSSVKSVRDKLARNESILFAFSRSRVAPTGQVSSTFPSGQN